MSSTLQHALEALYGLERRKSRLGLDGTRALLAGLGDPHRRFRSIHVAGTNGKGWVSAAIERVLREAGVRTGLFTSPHLVDFRERIRVVGQWADEARLERTLERIQTLPAREERTFFEVCTALAFDDFAARAVDRAVVEVGLGGRLDCTNVIDPELTIITSIGLDHREILGDTLAAIAAEKAGIVKPGVPLVLPPLPAEARDTIERIAAERGSPVHHVAPAANAVATSTWGVLRVEGLAPLAQLNAGTAIAALDALAGTIPIAREAVVRGLARTRWPGRLERCPNEARLWWDGGHNPDGIAAVERVWDGTGVGRPAAIVLAVGRDKETGPMLAALDRLSPGARLIATRSRSERALPPERIAELARHGGGDDPRAWAGGWSAEIAPDVRSACWRALETATAERPAFLVGSLFAVGEAMEAFGGAPGEWQ